jgi:hypothetical protein
VPQSTQISRCESVALRDGLREIQAALRKFFTTFGRRSPSSVYERYSRATIAMRPRVAAASEGTAEAFGVPVDGDLAAIVREAPPHMVIRGADLAGSRHGGRLVFHVSAAHAEFIRELINISVCGVPCSKAVGGQWR